MANPLSDYSLVIVGGLLALINGLVLWVLSDLRDRVRSIEHFIQERAGTWDGDERRARVERGTL